MSEHPNVLWIYCDELRTDALGCYGNEQFDPKTPHIDSVAESGVRFDNCFCNSSVCVPSRVSTFAGLYPEDTGAYHNEGAWNAFRLPRELTTFPEVFARCGYATGDFGKMHLPPEMQPWEHRRREGGGIDEIATLAVRDGQDLIFSGKVHTCIGGPFPADIPFPPEQVTRNALEWIERTDGPFLARISYLQPHTPVCPPPPFDRLYPRDMFRGHLPDVPHASTFEREFAEVIGAGCLTPRQIQLAQAYYYGLVGWIDSQVGQVLEYLRSSGRDHDTIVIFGTDHGVALGEGGCYAKHTFAPHVHRVPHLISSPSTIPGGEVRPEICEGLDLPRTLFGLCGIDVPDQFKGRDLFATEPPEGVYATVGFGLPDSWAFPNLDTGRYTAGRGWPRRACIRTERWRLDMNVRIDGRDSPRGDRDVFLTDWKADPRESTNLADDPEAGAARRRLEAMLEEHIAGAVEPDPDAVRR